MADLNTSIRIAVLDAFSAPLKSLGLDLTAVAGKAKKIGAAFDLAAKVSQASEAVGRFASAAQAAVAAPANEFIAFEHQMSKVAAVGGLTGDSFERLKAQALSLGAATRYSATQAAEAQENLVSAGFDVNEIMKLTPVALSLATAGDLELARSSEILAGTLRAFGKDASQAANVSDVLASGAALSSANIEYLSEVISKAGPVAKTLGVDLETVAAAGAAFADAQIGAAEGGTALKTVMLRLSAPARAAEKAFQQLGFGKVALKGLQEQLGKGDMPGALKRIGESFNKLGLTAVQRVEKMKHIFGDEAVAQASVLIDAAMKPSVDAHGLQQVEEAFRHVDGSAAKMAARMDDDTAGSLDRLSSAWSDFLIHTGERMAPALNRLSEGLQLTIDDIGAWVEKNPELAAQLGTMGIAVTGTAFALKGLMIIASASVSTFGALQTAYVGIRTAVLFLTPEIVAAKLAALAASPAFTALSGSMLGKAGLVGGALAAGLAIGTLLNKLFGLDEKLARLFAKLPGMGPGAAEQRSNIGKDLGTSRQEYADGTVVDGKTGKIVALGNGPASSAPKFVREARAGGAVTLDEINAFSAKRASTPAPASSKDAPASGSDRVVDAVKENTAATKALLAEQQRQRPRRGVSGSGAGTGAF